MPYLDKITKQGLLYGEEKLDHPGKLNYLLTNTCLEYLLVNEECYNTYNDIVGALEACKLEFYRRMVAPYETLKCCSNGEVFPKGIGEVWGK